MLTIHHYPGADADDFAWGVEGELAVPATLCTRSHTGLNSHRGSTTLMVRDLDLSFDDLVSAYAGYLEQAWAASARRAKRLARNVISNLLAVAANYQPGTVLRPTHDDNTGFWRYRPVVAT
ncbi:hypothetical protein MCNS_16350 [Mycobacterium conspicuum]|uniref:DUF7715 domain-containing protein n=1 Tax=Mycobacterium conspicuum TaxID=44010 RepID=A0A7I7YBY1_9MYCO|nr:hypothetical protein MCNS_16350 [Mycobacterium conspicuum]